MTVAEFMRAAPAPVAGNTPWAARYANTVRKIITDAAANAPRSLQSHLGPSELGVACDRQVVGKLAGLPGTNHVSDGWAAWVGTACHAAAAEVFDAENVKRELRWLTETPVTPDPAHPGTSDLYDALEYAVVDHKFLGGSSLAKVRSGDPGTQYRVQLLLYARGFRNLGLRVDRVALIAYPRTASSLDGLYVWEHELTAADDVEVDQWLLRTQVRAQVANEVRSGAMDLMQVPATPDDDTCYFCPFYRPQSARDGGRGCPGGRHITT